MKELQILAICLLFAWEAAGCRSDSSSFVRREKDIVALIDGFASYQNINEVKKRLADASLSVEILEDSHLGQKDRRPPFDVYTISVKNYTHLSCTGELLLFFFNDRLMETRFFPNEPDTYILSMEKHTGMNLQENSEIQPTAHARVRRDYDYTKRQYVSWQDVRLIEEQQQWIRNYS